MALVNATPKEKAKALMIVGGRVSSEDHPHVCWWVL
jgi:hypothetical protein